MKEVRYKEKVLPLVKVAVHLMCKPGAGYEDNKNMYLTI